MVADAHAVGLRDLRHHTSEVLARVRHGETIDVTEHGRLIARIVPVEDRQPAPVLARLVESGRATLAQRPGYRPRMRPGDGTDRLSGTLAALRDEESWLDTLYYADTPVVIRLLVEESPRDLLLVFSFVAIDDDIVETAMNEPDRELGSLDALVSYDDCPLKAATDSGLASASPRN